MRLSALFPWTVRRLGIFILVFGTLIQQVYTVPHAVYVRQTPLSLLKLPECALRCFVNHIIDDSCAIITDFACHCGDGTLLDAYSECLAQHCDQSLRDSAINSLRDDCGGSLSDDVTAVNGTTTVDDDPKIGSRNATSTSSSQLSSTITNVAEPTQPSESNSSSSVPIKSTSSTQLSTMVQTTIVSITTTETSRAAPSPPPQSTPTTTTEVPLAPLAQSMELSHAARAGIGVSVAVVASVVTVGLGWYIRRLKRQLYAAQEVIITTTNGIDRMDRMDRMDRNDPGLPAPPPSARTRQYVRSWLSNNTEPISPISAHPRPMEEGGTTIISNIGYGMVLKKRGNVLSILVEREGEGDEYAERSVREPVPGQREGLTSPLELDGIGTGLFEMPISITPRRSIER